MATRVELLDAFEAKLAGEGSFLLPPIAQPNKPVTADGRSRIEETRTSIDGTHSVEWHICFYWDQPAWNIKNQHFWVVDPGTEEVANWMGNDPKPEPPEPTFQQEMTTWLNSQLDVTFGTVTLRHIESTSANNDLERGTASVILETSTGDFVRESIAAWRAAGQWQFKVLVE